MNKWLSVSRDGWSVRNAMLLLLLLLLLGCGIGRWMSLGPAWGALRKTFPVMRWVLLTLYRAGHLRRGLRRRERISSTGRSRWGHCTSIGRLSWNWAAGRAHVVERSCRLERRRRRAPWIWTWPRRLVR